MRMRKAVYITFSVIAIVIAMSMYLLLTQRATQVEQKPLLPDEIKAIVSGARKSLVITSKSFFNGSRIPSIYTCDSIDISPHIEISNIPPEAKSIVLIVYDPDAPMGVFYHWIVYNLSCEAFPSYSIVLEENASKSMGLSQGLNDFRVIGYRGPCPPEGDKPHRYVFLALAVDIDTNWVSGLSPSDVLNRLRGHVIAYGYIFGYYSR